MGGQRLLERVKNRLRGTERKEEPSTTFDAQPSKTRNIIVVPKIFPLEMQESDSQPPVAESTPPAVTTEPPLASNQSEKDSERKRLQEKLWNKAYDSLRDSGNKHMAQYEEILIFELRKDKPDEDSVSLGTTQEQRWRQMQRLVEIGLSKTEKEARGNEMANSGLELFGTVRALVEPAVSAVPHAAIPWKECPVRFIVSSRNWVEFQDAFTKKSSSFKRVVLSLEDNEEVRESIKHAVDAFIKYKVEELERHKDTAIDAEVHDIFAEKSGNTFLWVALAGQKLLDVDSWQIVDTLKGFPSGLKDLYRRIMQEVMDSDHASQCRDILAVATLIISLAILESIKKTLKYDIYDLKKPAADIQDLDRRDAIDPLAPVSSCLAAAHEDFTIQLYDTTGDEFKKILTIETTGKVMVGLLFSPDDEWLACWERTYLGPEVQIRDAKTGDCIYKIALEEKLLIGPEVRFCFSSDSQRILLGSEQPGIWDIRGCKWINHPETRPERLLTSEFSSESTWVGHVFGEHGHSIWRFSDTDANQVAEMLREDGYGLPTSGQHAPGRPRPTDQRPSAISNDGKKIATCTEYPFRVAIVDTSTGAVALAHPRTTTAAGGGLPKAMAWSVDNRWLAVGAVEGNGQIGIWDPKSIKDSSEKEEVRKHIQAMTLSPDGRRFASGSEDGIIEVMDMARPGKTMLTLEGHESAI
ncbi:unnamed protein product [Fusarium graminearum]|uniref:NWD NACHT-NTPase N-terminal domain-containing protein n=1 Tax=Gibberella zeae TaxID=5518 RepID=A0A9N8WVH9_GIBZA|nr:unnamed protein product [Fusarium graminearum]